MKVTIVGASGYTGSELLRLLVNHPEIDGITATSRTYAGKKVSDLHRNLHGIYNEKFHEFSLSRLDSDVVFLATPHTESMEYAPRILGKGIRVIDLSADYRFKDKRDYEKIYGKHKNPELLKQAVYGVPELFRNKIKNAKLVANPGCYALGAILAIAPLAKFQNKLDVEKIVVDAKSGTSGAGAKLSDFIHHPEVHDNLKPYKMVDHRHQPEIESVLLNFFKKIKISFTPTLVPIIRGILTNVHVFSTTININFENHYKTFYKNEPFVRIMDVSYVKDVLNTNYCDISVHLDAENSRVLVISAIDNLIKGAAGNAIQNMNLMLGYKETTGLKLVAGHP